MRRRTTTGHVAHINLNGEGKCGGAVARLIRRTQAASSASMRARKMTRMMGLEMERISSKNYSRSM